MKVKVSDYIVNFLEGKKVTSVFGYQGSSVSHLIDSLSKSHSIEYIQGYHEQGAAFAANGYALATDGFGVAVSCSGPGATNLITGIANAFYDSIPCMFFCGQVSTHPIREDLNVRQYGFQETDIVSMVSSITQYAITVTKPESIGCILEEAYDKMMCNRPGPVLIDVPHNIQTAVIDINLPKKAVKKKKPKALGDDARQVASLLREAKHPVILVGGGLSHQKDAKTFAEMFENSNIPVVASYRGKTVLDHFAPYYCGIIGSYGNRWGNYAIYYSDVLLVLGSRLDERQTGGNFKNFAPNSTVIVVDIDENELQLMPQSYKKIQATVTDFMTAIKPYLTKEIAKPDWLNAVQGWKQRYSDTSEYHIKDYVNPNMFLRELSQRMPEKTIYTLDVGQNQIWGNSSLMLTAESILLQSAGLGSMGFSIPAAIGAFEGIGGAVCCICGDGGFQMNIQELQTAKNRNIPLKIFVLNNNALGLIRVYQEKALQSNYVGSVLGFSVPNLRAVAEAYGYRYYCIDNNKNIPFNDIIDNSVPTLVEVCISEKSTCFPEPTYRSTIENQSPELSVKEIEELERVCYE